MVLEAKRREILRHIAAFRGFHTARWVLFLEVALSFVFAYSLLLFIPFRAGTAAIWACGLALLIAGYIAALVIIQHYIGRENAIRTGVHDCFLGLDEGVFRFRQQLENGETEEAVLAVQDILYVLPTARPGFYLRIKDEVFRDTPFAISSGKPICYISGAAYGLEAFKGFFSGLSELVESRNKGGEEVWNWDYSRQVHACIAYPLGLFIGLVFWPVFSSFTINGMWFWGGGIIFGVVVLSAVLLSRFFAHRKSKKLQRQQENTR